ncbi:PREDICTED: probable cyclic nucleotide-gated ion channel 3 isoform X2 [Tarenaya hassleriana]|uniref:probable cyclic nucleotide-gated ion channel 3 isoform X2 n=1 Tax=Tarenaya hassleriana TaxID=28532 RepID=UPI00053C52E2|nr:PREDICTED: probable cyclic nucleotide-gated ion channel 3 isoform X2 [Tarenaya hassleriana]
MMMPPCGKNRVREETYDMKHHRNKFVRLDEFPTKTRPSLTAALNNVRKGLEKGSKNIRAFKTSFRFHTGNDHSAKKERVGTRMTVLNPRDSFLQNWNKVFLLLCVIALAFDPLFFYIPVVDRDNFCLNLDKRLQIIASVLRTVIDAFYVIHIVFQFRTGFVPPSSRVFGRGELIDDPKAIAKRYLFSYFVVDILAILPLPQVVVLAIIPKMKRPASLVTKELLKWVIFCQYAPRITRILPLFKEVTRNSGMVTETAWAGAALNLFLYTLASHVFGAFWYLISIERKDRCWREACEKIPECIHANLYCEKSGENNRRFLNSTCPLIDPGQITDPTVFNFGIFTDALQSGVVETMDFPKKFLYCFWWGLRNLSAVGQNLNTSDFVGEVIFAIIICVSGLVLFALLIGNMQKYLQSTTVRVEEMRVRRMDAEQWMSHRMLPEEMRKRIRRYEQYRWQETRGVEEESLLRSLPKDLRRDIKSHLCLNLLKSVPWFQAMDERILDALCDRLKTKLYTENSYITREGDPVEDMLFIMRGNLISSTTSGGRTGFYNAIPLKAGDFCGDLFTWALDPHSSSNLPTSTTTVQAITEVEGFVLSADDLKFVATQYRRIHSKQLRHMFRYYSVQWQTWAACFIQVAWKRHCGRKLSKALLAAEEIKLQSTLQTDSGNPKLKLGATIYVSKFASNAIRNLRANSASFSRYPKMLPLVPQKPADPEFEPVDET